MSAWKAVPREVMEDGSVYPAHVIDDNGIEVCWLESLYSAESRQRNPPSAESVTRCDGIARLITAAPETAAERDQLKAVNAQLVEALRALLPILDNDGPLPRAYADVGEQARAALAAAGAL